MYVSTVLSTKVFKNTIILRDTLTTANVFYKHPKRKSQFTEFEIMGHGVVGNESCLQVLMWPLINMKPIHSSV